MRRTAILLGATLALAAMDARADVPADARMKGPFLIASTPYLEDGAVDFDALVAEVRYMDAAGCTGVIWPQSNDAIDLLTPEEKREGLRRLAAAAASFTNAVLTIGVSGTNTAQTLAFAAFAEALASRSSAPIALAARPPTYACTAAEVEACFEALGRVAKRPVVIQTFVSDDCPAPSVAFLVELARRFPGVYGYIKEESEGARANARQAEEVAAKPVVKTVFSAWGGWQWLYQRRALGTEGLVSERPAYAPLVAHIWRTMQAGDPDGRLQEAYAMYRYLIDQRAIPGGSLRGYSLYYLKKLGLFRTTLSRTYLASRVTESGTFGVGHEWKLVDIDLTDAQRAELDANFEGMRRFLAREVTR
ncbi:MAG: dihydrodipicolinate synthase family protein [Kiritimatiellia bacterium]